MALLVSEAIEPHGIGCLEPVHAFTEIGVLRRQHQVVVIGHEHKGVQLPLIPLTRFREDNLERLSGSVGCKDVTAIVASIDQMVP